MTGPRAPRDDKAPIPARPVPARPPPTVTSSSPENEAEGTAVPLASPEAVRPTPVREAMESQGTGAGRVSSTVVEVPFSVGEEAWIARSGGRVSSGSVRDSGVSLTLVLFSPEGADAPTREAWLLGWNLDGREEGELRLLFDGSRPYKPLPPPEKARGRGRRPPRQKGR